MRIITIFSIISFMLIANLALANNKLPTPSTSSLPKPHTITQNLDGIAAVVNDDVITQSELSAAIERIKKQMIASGAKDINNAELKNNVLQQLINQKLLMQLAKRANISVDDKQVDQAIAHIAKANHLSVKQLEGKLKSQGMSLAEYKKEIKKQITLHQVQMSAVSQDIQVTDEDVAKFLKKYKDKVAQAKQYHVLDLHIDASTADKKALSKAKQLMVSWKKGKLSSSNITDLGWQSAKTLPTIFLDQLAHMKKGDIAGPIAAPNGFHIIKLVGTKSHAPSKMPSDAQIKNMIFQQKSQKAVEKWLKKIRKSAYIKITE